MNTTGNINTNNRHALGNVQDCRNTVAHTSVSDLHSGIVMLSERGNPITNSLLVAKHFEKEHRNVIRSIRNLAAQNRATKYFYETTFENRGQKYPMFLMTQEGFSLLVMGFTGKKAFNFKMDFIDAFKQLKSEIKAQQQPKLDHYNKVLNPSNTVNTTEIASDLNLSARELNKTLQKRGIIYKMKNGKWMAASKYIQKGYAKLKTDVFFNPQLQKDQTTHTLQWTEAGRAFINSIINQHQTA